VAFFLVPLGMIVYVSLQSGGLLLGGFHFTWEFSNYAEALADGREFLIRSIVYATAVTSIALLISYPMTYWIAFYAGRWKASFLFLILAPFFVSFVIRTIQWGFLLADNGVILGPLKTIGLLPEDFRILATPAAVIAGITYNYLPFTALPLFVALDRIDRELVVAAKDLYASRWQAFRRVVLPLSVPGIFAAIVLTFVPATGDYVNADVLGGPGTTMIGNVIQAKFLIQGDYPEAAALSVVLMVVMLVLALIYARVLGTEDASSELVPALKTSSTPVGQGRWTRFILPAYTIGVILLLCLPIFVMILYGFNDVPGDRQSAKFFGFTLHWYVDLFGVSGLTEALVNSLWIAPLSALVSTVLGTLLGLSLGRYRFAGRAVASFVIFLAIAIPEILFGASLLSLFVNTKAPLGPITVFISHIAFSVGFVAVTVRARIHGMGRTLEDVAQDLYATPITTFFKVTLPTIFPAVLAGYLLAFVLSLDDFVITSFVRGQMNTFPIWVYGASRIGIPPQVNVMGTLLFATALTLALVNIAVVQRGSGTARSRSRS
jgi:spermidine/putrescine transport system permease protein